MAKIKQGILGGFSGKVANVVGTSWKGRAVMKSQPLSVSNPRTEAQQEQRGKFSKIAELASAILTQFVQPVENPISGDISGYNKFCKDNKGAFDGAGALVPANFFCGGGKIINLASAEGNTAANDEVVQVKWTNDPATSALRLTDKVYMAVFDEDAELVALSSGATTRTVGFCNADIVKEDWTPTEGETLIALYACVSADGRDVSVKTSALSFEVSEQ